MGNIKDLAVDVKKEYERLKSETNIQPFNAGIVYCDHNHHMKEVENLEKMDRYDIHAVYFDPKDMRDGFEIYWSKYKSHTIKDGVLEINLTGNYKRSFDLE